MNAELRIYGGIGLPDEYGNVFAHSDLVTFLDANTEATEITLRINSPGGYVRTGNAILETLRNSGKAIHTVGEELVGSMATQIFLMGETRRLYPSTEFFLHNVQGGVKGSPDEIEAYLNEMKESNERGIDFYLARTGLDRETLTTLLNNEVTISGNDALELGFATALIEPVAAYIKRPNQMKLVDKIKAAFSPSQVEEATQDLSLSLEDGRMLQVSTGDEMAKVGDTVRIDGSAAEDGEYKLAEDKIIVIQSGAITDVRRIQIEAPEVVEEDADPQPAAAEDSAARIEALENELSELREAMVTQSQEQGKAFANLAGVLKNMTSGQVNPTVASEFSGEQEDSRPLSERVSSLKEARAKAISTGNYKK